MHENQRQDAPLDRTQLHSIHEVAQRAGITSRTLRHYGDVGILRPSRVGANGYRFYDAAALVRLQRILLLRDLGLGIRQIADVLEGRRDDGAALRTHAELLRDEREQLDRRIAAVERTIRAMEEGRHPMPEEMFDGFDHTKNRDEVVERWGDRSWRDASGWWDSMSAAEQTAWRDRQSAHAAEWTDAATRGVAPDSPEAQRLAERHRDWLAAIPGTPGHPGGPDPDYLTGLGEMYVADERFAANYGGLTGATLVRDALRHLVT